MQWHKAAVSWFGTTAQKNKAGSFPNYCTSALVFGDCTPVSRVDLQRCKCSGTRLQSAGLAQQHRRTRQFTLNSALHWCLVTAHLYVIFIGAKCTGVWRLHTEWIFIGKNAVAQGCCQLVWHSSTEEQGRQFS